MRKPRTISNNNNSYRLIDFINKTDDYIYHSNGDSLLVNYESLIGHLDLLKRILEIKDINQINCVDYKSAIIIENEINTNRIPLYLVDDYKNRDRSYINTQFFKRHKLSIPISYTMWNIDVQDNINIASFCHKDNRNMHCLNGDTKLDKETLLKVKEIIQNIKIPKNDIQKCVLISNYLQSKIQYIDGTETNVDNKIYVVDKDLTSDECGLVKNVLFNNFGICISIANATTLLLNNPWMNVNVRSIAGSNHVWNIVNIDDEMYYIDNTWNITKNPNKITNSLKANKFTDQFILFGQTTNKQLSNHISDSYIPGIISEFDYDKKDIMKAANKIKRKMPLNYGNHLPINSHLK